MSADVIPFETFYKRKKLQDLQKADPERRTELLMELTPDLRRELAEELRKQQA